jgi:hypothetical protein
MDARTRRDIAFLKAYALVSTLLFGVLAMAAFRVRPQKPRFDEIDVSRINIVEKDGRLKMVISSKDHFPDPVIDGVLFKRRGGNPPGIIFYNDEGDEDGGLAFGGQTVDGKKSAHASLLFDQYKQDQTVGITYTDTDGQRTAGFNVWDRSDIPISQTITRLRAARALPDGPQKTAALDALRAEGPGGVQRIFVGKKPDRTAGVFLSDVKGRARIVMTVDTTGAAKLEFLDANGTVVYRVPEKL